MRMPAIALACTALVCAASLAQERSPAQERKEEPGLTRDRQTQRQRYGPRKGEIKDPRTFYQEGEERAFSGPPAGAELLSFTAVELRGEGKEFDPIAKAGKKPHVLLFTKGAAGGRIVRLLGRQLGSIKQVSGKDVHMTVVHLSDNPSEIGKFIGVMKSRVAESVDLCLSIDGAEGPGNYRLDRNVTHTFLIAKEGLVVHNLAFRHQVFFNEPHVLGAIADVLEVDDDTLDTWLASNAVIQGRREHRGLGDRDRSAAQAVLRARLGALVEAGKISRKEARELYDAVFAENVQDGAGSQSRPHHVDAR